MKNVLWVVRNGEIDVPRLRLSRRHVLYDARCSNNYLLCLVGSIDSVPTPLKGGLIERTVCIVPTTFTEPLEC